MVCPNCKADNDRVLDSRDHVFSVRRRRECNNCGCRYTTIELTAMTRKAIKTLDNLAERIYNIKRGSGNG